MSQFYQQWSPARSEAAGRLLCTPGTADMNKEYALYLVILSAVSCQGISSDVPFPLLSTDSALCPACTESCPSNSF